MKVKNIYFWRCHHDAYSGKDRECCHAHGNLTNLETAIKNGRLHNESHRWCNWGYPPLGWKNKTVNIFRKTPKGEEALVIIYNEL